MQSLLKQLNCVKPLEFNYKKWEIYSILPASFCILALTALLENIFITEEMQCFLSGQKYVLRGIWMVLVWVPIIIEPRQIPPPYRNAVKGERCIDFPSVNRFLKAYTLLFSLETEDQAYQQTHSFTAAAQTKKTIRAPFISMSY